MQQQFDKKIRLSDIKRLDNFYDKASDHTYKKVWVFTPFMDNNLHIGYLDGRFFAYTRQAYGAGIDIDVPETVVNYYLNNIFFQIEAVEKDMIMQSQKYRIYKISLDNYIKMQNR